MEAREKNEQARQVENFMFLRLVKLMIKCNREQDTLREILNSHETFNINDAFRVFDKDNSGYITAENLREGFESHNITVSNIDAIMGVLDFNNDGKIDYREF